MVVTAGYSVDGEMSIERQEKLLGILRREEAELRKRLTEDQKWNRHLEAAEDALWLVLLYRRLYATGIGEEYYGPKEFEVRQWIEEQEAQGLAVRMNDWLREDHSSSQQQ